MSNRVFVFVATVAGVLAMAIVPGIVARSVDASYRSQGLLAPLIGVGLAPILFFALAAAGIWQPFGPVPLPPRRAMARSAVTLLAVFAPLILAAIAVEAPASGQGPGASTNAVAVITTPAMAFIAGLVAFPLMSFLLRPRA